MNDTTTRPWGEARDREAAKQLGLEGDHTIFMMATECIDYINDVRDILDDFDGVSSGDEIVDEIIAHMKSVKLPNGFCLVAMRPFGGGGPETYGIVDWRLVEANSRATQGVVS